MATSMADAAPGTEGGGAAVRVRIDHDLCSGTAHCQQSMPDVFVVTARKSHVRSDVDWESVDVAHLRNAADHCPWFAISVETSAPEGP